MKKLYSIWIVALVIMAFFGCNKDNEKPYTDVPLVILDTDIGSSTDDLFALEMLYRYEEQGKCRLQGVIVNREGEANARFADVMGTYFGHDSIPIGLVRNGVKNPPIWIDYAHVAATEDHNGQPMFACSINDCPPRKTTTDSRCLLAASTTTRSCPTDGSSIAVCWLPNPIIA